MLWALLAASTLGAAGGPDLLADAITRFQALESYRVTLRSEVPAHTPQVIRYSYRRPGWIRMDFDTPHHGAVLIYDPDTQQVRLWPFGLQHFPRLTLAPGNPLIRDPHGHTVARSHAGALLENVRRLRQGGSLELGAEQRLGRWQALPLTVTGAGTETVGKAHRFQLWLEREHLFPLKVVSYGTDGSLRETVWLDDVEFDVALPGDWFQPR